MRLTVALAGMAGMAGLAGCPQTPNTPEILDGNFDQQIDGLADLEEGDDGNTVESFDARMCVSDGNVYVVWRDARDNFSDVWFNRSTDGGESFLTAPIRVKQGPGNAEAVQMSCQGDRIYVVWEDTRDGDTEYQNIYMNFSSNGGDDWQNEDIQVDNDPDGFAISLGPQILLDSGKVHVVWYDQVEGAPDIYMATSINGGRSFQEPIRISGAEDEAGAGVFWSGNPKVALDPANGDIHVVWEDTRNGRQDIFAAVSNDEGRTFGPQKRIDKGDDPGSNFSFSPQIGVDGGNVYVVWHDSRAGDGRDIYMNYSSNGGDSWLQQAVRVEADAAGFSESINPQLVVAGDVAHVVWQDQRNVGYDIYYRSAAAGVLDTTSEDGDLRIDRDPPGAGNSALPVIAIGEDTMVIAWSDYRDDAGAGYNDLYYNFTPMEDLLEGWAEEDLRLDSIANGTSFTEDLTIAIDDGKIHSTWIDGRGGSRDVFFSSVIIGESVENYLDYVDGGSAE